MKKLLHIFSIIIAFGFTLVISFQLMIKSYSKELTTEVFSNSNISYGTELEINKQEKNNSDIVAILSIPVLDLKEAVVQTDNNDYYMTHDINKKNNSQGSIFMDYRNNLDSKKIIIYGHNLKISSKKSGFSKLTTFINANYEDEKYFLYLYTDREVSTWKVFSIMIVPNNTTKHTKISFNSELELQEHLDWMVSNSIIDFNTNVDVNDYLMTLQTCLYEPDNSFLLINLKRVNM